MVLYNSLTRQKEPFQTLQERKVSMYVCGITPYDTTHLGHAFTYIFFDVLNRYLIHKGHRVTYTQNVTDINDRDTDILARARGQNVPWQDLVDFWTKRFLSDMEALNWVAPTNYIKASEQIEPMVELIQRILESGAGYEKNGGIYLDITKYPGFGKLSKLSQDQMFERAREFDEDLDNPAKRHPLDITLWKPSKPDEPRGTPSFESPFGAGRPGWHIECSAMAISSLSEQIDIHGGGQDLIYPHHEAEITQSEVATGKVPFAAYWLHVGEVRYRGKKMSKSLGNLILVRDLLKKHSPNAIRWVLLSHQWRVPWEFHEEELDRAGQKLQSIEKSLSKQKPSQQSNNVAMKQFESIVDDDINTPKALQYITSLAEKGEERNTIQKSLTILGFKL